MKKTPILEKLYIETSHITGLALLTMKEPDVFPSGNQARRLDGESSIGLTSSQARIIAREMLRWADEIEGVKPEVYYTLPMFYSSDSLITVERSAAKEWRFTTKQSAKDSRDHGEKSKIHRVTRRKVRKT